MIEEIRLEQQRHGNLADRALKSLVTFAAKRLLSWQPNGSILIEFPNAEQVRFGKATDAGEAKLKLQNYGVLAKSLRRGTLGFADAYIKGDVECPDLVSLFKFFIANRDNFMNTGNKLFDVRGKDRVAHAKRNNSKAGSRKNISEHYDLGNDFYRLWLDQDMNYSSGLYTKGAKTLEEAQRDKLHLILEMLELKREEKILEIGCGWGAFAKKAAEEHQAHITGLTLSHEQLAFAAERASQSGLAEQCEFRLQDYRDVSGQFDRIVSIEMIEAVGEEHWSRYFNILHDRLKAGGTAAIQAITIDEKYFESYRSNPDFIQRYIFPGGMLPTPEQIFYHAEKAGLQLQKAVTFGECYAKTLREWRARFETAWPEISKLGFDQNFRRKWRYYLEYCEAGFWAEMIDVGVYQFKKVG